ncbi:MAG: acyl-CoA thioester hydrolase/BAAT C-terminal domain-containing protein [Corynebacterium sp.]|uniref:acyl-CoA thioester hydrolase/BAAT C-terminal domain-containing protein n=1 Tax=Corynebacterium sp. TaxID=1720 RepID=UPI0026DF8889|nr:acyl-CoA thioester hydrolase/BAAT C-terminal domain-containing protein [Corynebacterium sp.]MDO5670982.1 acyl-CoA thioester hydrolase/BAAT C-terminal domain-containing protein [Corynebacterium sp.]
MKTFFKVLGGLVTVVLVLWGVRAYNLNYYAIPGPDVTDRGDALTHGGESVDGDYLRGIHYRPDAADSYPGMVIIFGGSEGSAGDAQARQLAAQGFDVLALYYFGQQGQPKSLSEVPLDFFREALDWIDKHQEQSGPLTVIGTSKGAELTANLAVRYPEIDHIVLYTPSEYTYAGLQFESNEQTSSFTWQGQPLPFAEFPFDAGMIGRMILGLPVSYRSTYEDAARQAPLDARIDIGRFDGEGLLLAGDADAMWQGDIAARALAAQNPRLEPHIFPGAGHLFAEDIAAYGNSWETMLGGTVEGNRQAKQESDRLLLAHLSRWHDE